MITLRNWIKFRLLGLIGLATVALALIASQSSLRAEEDWRLNRKPHTNRGVVKILYSKLPEWRVGFVDKSLSQKCSLGQFNQKVPYRYSAQFIGENGTALVGGVKGSGLNLFDPYNQSNPARDYWFYRDRTSACVVYWAWVKPPQQQTNATNSTNAANTAMAQPTTLGNAIATDNTSAR